MYFPPIILGHVITAVGALVIGAGMFVFPKGTLAHRMSGRVWVLLMLTTALLSFGIKSFDGSYSWIHLLSVLTLYGLGAAMWAIYRGDIAAHKRRMKNLYIGLSVAALFTLLPGRRLGTMLWHTIELI